MPTSLSVPTSTTRHRAVSRVAVALAAGAALVLAGCATTASAGGSTPGGSGVQEGGQAAFGTPFTYGDGLSVQVDAPARFTPTAGAEWERGTKDVVVRVKVTVVNGSPAAYSPDMLSTTAVSAGAEAPAVLDSASRIALTGPDVVVDPAQDVTFHLAYAVTDPDDVTVTVEPALGGYGPILFSLDGDAAGDAS